MNLLVTASLITLQMTMLKDAWDGNVLNELCTSDKGITEMVERSNKPKSLYEYTVKEKIFSVLLYRKRRRGF